MKKILILILIVVFATCNDKVMRVYHKEVQESFDYIDSLQTTLK